MIKKLILAIVTITLFFSSCKSTKHGVIEHNQKSENQKLDDALLWKIEGAQLTTPSYLFGTIHIINSDDYFLPQGTLTAIDAVTNMVFEIDMNEMSDMSNIMGLMSKAFMKDGKTLRDLLSTDDYSVVDNHFKKIGMPLVMLERIKPMFLSALAYGDMDPAGLQNGSMKSYEMEFYEMAKQADKPVSGLETIEFQMSIFDSIPYQAQAEMLVETIKKSDSESDEFEVMTKLYKSQNITGMIEMIGDDTQQLSEHEEVLVSKRNRNWIPVMREMMNNQPTFFAVGAGHLAGDQGVIKLLQREGYTVTPISNMTVNQK